MFISFVSSPYVFGILPLADFHLVFYYLLLFSPFFNFLNNSYAWSYLVICSCGISLTFASGIPSPFTSVSVTYGIASNIVGAVSCASVIGGGGGSTGVNNDGSFFSSFNY